MSGSSFVDPIAKRYASQAMLELFSPRRRALVWRDLWIALARSQSEMGLPVKAAQVRELEAARDEIDLEAVAVHEKRLRHDVMAHVHAFGDAAPGARGIIHLGATSCYVTDNADLILIREALGLVGDRMLRLIHTFAGFAREHASVPTLGLTHLQPAQLTTVGKRAALWTQDLVDVWRRLDELRQGLSFRGVKGTTGTQASFLHLFDGNASRVDELEDRVARYMGFEKIFPITGQTYPRFHDFRLSSQLAEIGVVMHKISTDLRLLQSWGEIDEPFEKEQIGSSAMPYKRNPMRCERIGALSKLLMHVPASAATMAATQWFERTLDDSALRRVIIPQAFLTTDATLIIGRNVARGLTLHTAVAQRRVCAYLPFLAAEELLMSGVTQGGDRQRLHERLRQLCWSAAEVVRDGGENPLRKLIEDDEELGPVLCSLPDWQADRFVGLAPQQTIRYLDEVVSKLPSPEEDDLLQLSV